jgi:hypothetical protein
MTSVMSVTTSLMLIGSKELQQSLNSCAIRKMFTIATREWLDYFFCENFDLSFETFGESLCEHRRVRLFLYLIFFKMCFAMLLENINCVSMLRDKER